MCLRVLQATKCLLNFALHSHVPNEAVLEHFIATTQLSSCLVDTRTSENLRKEVRQEESSMKTETAKQVAAWALIGSLTPSCNQGAALQKEVRQVVSGLFELQKQSKQCIRILPTKVRGVSNKMDVSSQVMKVGFMPTILPTSNLPKVVTAW